MKAFYITILYTVVMSNEATTLYIPSLLTLHIVHIMFEVEIVSANNRNKRRQCQTSIYRRNY